MNLIYFRGLDQLTVKNVEEAAASTTRNSLLIY